MNGRPATVKEGFYKAARKRISLAFLIQMHAVGHAVANEGRAMLAKYYSTEIGFRSKKADLN
jgi:hypothetical protein